MRFLGQKVRDGGAYLGRKLNDAAHLGKKFVDNAKYISVGANLLTPALATAATMTGNPMLGAAINGTSQIVGGIGRAAGVAMGI